MLGAVAPSCITMFVTFSHTPKGVDRDNKSPSPHGQTTKNAPVSRPPFLHRFVTECPPYSHHYKQ